MQLLNCIFGVATTTNCCGRLARFTLEGEGWAIDNIMAAFARRYVEEVPRPGLSPDDAHMLATAIIMLNMDLYNPQVWSLDYVPLVCTSIFVR
jgi:hypothetical protein